MAASIEIIEIRDIPIATLNASLRIICLESIKVSSMIDVIKPFMIARNMISGTESSQGLPVVWKKKIVPKSPIEQPRRHQSVFTDALFHVCLHFQLMLFFSIVVVIVLLKNIIIY
jgi:hypothetical protein